MPIVSTPAGIPARALDGRLVPLVLFVLGFAGAAVIYHGTAGCGFFYDDYHFVRPYPIAEIAGAFRGTWDPTHIEVPFYRPLTVVLFAARFLFLGFDAAAYHWASIVLFALVAALTGLLAGRLSGRPRPALLATALVCVHPAMGRSLVGWVTNQMHLAEALLVLSAYLVWFAVRRRDGAAWSLILVPAVAALLVKEDAVMLLVSVVLAHVLYRRFVDPTLPRVPAWFVAAAVIVPAAFAWLRYEMLGGLGGYGRPTPAIAVARIRDTVWSLLWQLSGRRPPQRILTVMLAIVLSAGVTIGSLRGAVPRFLLVMGAAVLLCFSLPFAFASKPEQLHLAALAVCLMLTGALEAVASVARGRIATIGWWLSVACFLGLMASISRASVAAYAADAPYTLHTDAIVQGWAAVPEEIRTMLSRKGAGDPLARIENLEYVTFGVGGSEPEPGGRTYRWTGERADFFTRASRGVLLLRLRGMMIPAIGRTRVDVYVDAAGSPSRHFALADDSWAAVGIPFERRWFTPRGVPSVRLRVTPTFEPAKVTGSADARTLGVQVADIRVQSRD